MSARTPRPSLAELRAVAQPPEIFARNSGEHWAGKLYVRRLSAPVTRLLIPTRVTPNALTWLMIAVGLAAAAVLTLPGVLAAVLAALLIQKQILLDCSDGELARWRKQFSPAGIYLDRLAHHVTETALPIGLGIRADGGWDSLGGWTTLGLAAAVLSLLVRDEGDLVAVTRLELGLGKLPDTADTVSLGTSGLRRARSWLARLPIFRAFIAVEFTLLALAAAIVDAVSDGVPGTRAFVVALVAIGAVSAALRPIAVLSSSRLFR